MSKKSIIGCGRSPDRATRLGQETGLSSYEIPFIKKETRCGTTHRHHPEPNIVVAVVRVVVVAISRAGVVLVVVPRTAAQDAPIARCPQVCLHILAVNLI